MTRMIKSKILESAPPPETPIISYAEFAAVDQQGESYRECKDAALAPLTVIPFQNTKAIILYTFIHRRERMDDYVPKYRVAVLTKAGVWSKMFIDIYPGDIQRAYEAQNACYWLCPR